MDSSHKVFFFFFLMSLLATSRPVYTGRSARHVGLHFLSVSKNCCLLASCSHYLPVNEKGFSLDGNS